MTFEFYVNGEKREPTPAECEKLIDNMMRPLGYEKKERSKPIKQVAGASA